MGKHKEELRMDKEMRKSSFRILIPACKSLMASTKTNLTSLSSSKYYTNL